VSKGANKQSGAAVSSPPPLLCRGLIQFTPSQRKEQSSRLLCKNLALYAVLFRCAERALGCFNFSSAERAVYLVAPVLLAMDGQAESNGG
jgi:hypothetical protein